jgi:exonuclease III
MAQLLKFAAWNVNGLCQHAQGIQIFIHAFNLDILLVSETHFTNRNYVTTPKYNIYYTNHPEERVHGGTAVIDRTLNTTLKQNIGIKIYKYAPLTSPLKTTLEKQQFPQSTALPSTTTNMTITIDFSKHSETVSLPEEIVMPKTPTGDLDSRLQKDEGYIKSYEKNVKHLSTRQPTYRPSDPNKIPDLVDFCVTKGTGTKNFTVDLCLDLT